MFVQAPSNSIWILSLNYYSQIIPMTIFDLNSTLKYTIKILIFIISILIYSRNLNAHPSCLNSVEGHLRNYNYGKKQD